MRSQRVSVEKASWFGRGELIDTICQALQRGVNCVFVVGFYGAGKTSILKAVKAQLDGPGGGLRVAYTDCALLANVPHPGAARATLALDWNQQLGHPDAEGNPLRLFEEDLSLNRASWREWSGAPHTISPLIILDNFDKLEEEECNEVARSLLALQTPSFTAEEPDVQPRLLISTAVDLPRRAKQLDESSSLLWARADAISRLLPLDFREGDLERFAEQFHHLKELRPAEEAFLQANCGGHPAFLHDGLESLAACKKKASHEEGGQSWLLYVYRDLTARTSGLHRHILHDLLLDRPEHQDDLFRLYHWAYTHNASWSSWRKQPSSAQQSTTEERGSSPMQERIDADLALWGLLVPAGNSYHLFSDLFADSLVAHMRSNAQFQEYTSAQVKFGMSTLELCIFELFLQHPDEELNESDLKKACWTTHDTPPEGRMIYSAVTRVQNKLKTRDPYHVVGQIRKKGRGRGWEYTRGER